MSKSSILAIIPARGGSKGIPRKCLAPMSGKPLIQHTFDAAQNSKLLDRIILSTDDEEIADFGRRSNIDVPFLRPASLASDTASMVPVVEHAVTWLAEHEDFRPDGVMLLQPTSPLRTERHIDEAITEFRDSDVGALVSVCEVKEHPYEMVSIRNGKMGAGFPDAEGFGRRQDFPEFFYVNGAIYLVETTLFLRDHTFLPEGTGVCMMDRLHSVDIDTPIDLHIAETLMNLSLDAPSIQVRGK